MKPVFVAMLHNLDISEPLGSGDKINDELRITNDRSVIDSLVQPGRRPVLGSMEVASLLSGAPVVFAEGDVPDNMTPQQHLLARLYEVQSFLMTTWMFQDNAINCEIGFLFTSTGASSNFVAHLFSTARGEKPVTTLSREQPS